MKLREYLEALNELVKENPDALEMEVAYTKDDEGNGYQYVSATPEVNRFMGEGGYHIELVHPDDFEEDPEDYQEAFKCVLIN